ncbi:MAG: PAS domain S-box protein [Candidatus Levybacteria bacterium]|nr:PAS domain S-box protein [Candidatus Levybacteria bacterium]MBP9815102.1 PAS domain S-box protein [Candidatus Levybacteria bacterium]
MKLKTQLFLITVFFITLAFIIGLIFILSMQQVSNSAKQGQKTYMLIRNILWSSKILSSYSLYHEDRFRAQWESKHHSIELLTNSVLPGYTSSWDKQVLKDLQEKNTISGEMFINLVNAYKVGSSQAKKDQLENSLIAISQDMLDSGIMLSDSNIGKTEKILNIYNLLITALLAIFTLASLVFIFVIFKSFIRPMSKLQKGIETITSGNLDYRLDIKSHDEIGQLAAAFNKMAKNLKESNEKTLLNSRDLKKFKMAVEFASDQIVITDKAGTVVYANKATEKITGYSVDKAMGKKAGVLWGGQMEKAFYMNMWKAINEKKDFEAEITNKRVNGEKYITEIHISPVLDDVANILFFVSIERDITKIKEIDRMKSEFISLASHQLRTPLGISKWYLEVIQKDASFKKLPKIEREYIAEIYTSNERLLSLVRELLSVSRIDQDRVKNNPQKASILELTKNVVKEMNVLAKKKNIKLDLAIKSTDIPLFNIDLERLHETIENLIANALQYTPDQGRVNVTIDRYMNKWVSISVQDSGIGISQADQKKLFSKFFRTENGSLKNTSGSGLGLYIVKSYVEEWGGKIIVESTEGKGSTFIVRLPFNISKKNHTAT